MLTAGTRLGPYEITGTIGAGGMGEVYRARDTRLGREVAIKVLPADLAADPDRLRRFELEARATAALSHPNILAVHDVGTHQGVPFLVEELLDGESLQKKLEHGALATGEALRIAAGVARGLAAAHDKGIVHRDLKPGNVFLTRNGTVKLLDFGLAKLLAPPMGDEDATDATTQAAGTGLGAILGTLPYMAPEQARGLPVDARTDVFAFGVVLYEMLAGARPFHGSTVTETAAAILRDEPPPLPAHVPRQLAAVVARCLAKEPPLRYQRAGEVQAALDAVASGSELASRVVWRSTLFRHRRRVTLALLSAVALVLIGLDVGGVRSRFFTPQGSGPTIRMAVLPFANLSGDPEQEYVADGVTQEMISQLGRLHPTGLAVIARASVTRYKDGTTPVDRIGRELGVDYLLAGSARREAGRVRITAELIQVRDQTQLWSETYEREMSAALALQSEVARRVAGSLALRLLPGEQARLARTRTVDPEAYDAFLRATHSRQSVTASGLDAAERYYTLAIERDPGYAAAWAGLARVWTNRQQMGLAPASEATREAKTAVLKALALDETDWDAQRALAGILTWGDWDWPASERKWKQVVELDPNQPEGLQGYSHFLMHMGRGDEAMRQIERALELDPFSVRTQGFYASVLLGERRYDEAIAAVRRAQALQPDTLLARGVLYEALLLKGRRDEALALDRETFGGDAELLEALRLGETTGGYNGAQQQLAAALAARSGKPEGVTNLALAKRWLYAGDHDRALASLERAYEDRDPNLPYLGQPIWDPIRPDPRFQALVQSMKLPAAAVPQSS